MTVNNAFCLQIDEVIILQVRFLSRRIQEIRLS